jgi:hypothetical protein
VLPETDASTTGRTRNPRIDQFDPGILQGRNQFHQRIDIPTDNSVTCFHALNGGDWETGEFGRLPLVYIQERAGGPELIGRDHEMAAFGKFLIEYIYTIQITASSINLDTKYITASSRGLEPDCGQKPGSNFYRRIREILSTAPEVIGS